MRAESWIVGQASAEDSAVILDLLKQNRLPVGGPIDHLRALVDSCYDGRVLDCPIIEALDR
jgi:hypothetical protein